MVQLANIFFLLSYCVYMIDIDNAFPLRGKAHALLFCIQIYFVLPLTVVFAHRDGKCHNSYRRWVMSMGQGCVAPLQWVDGISTYGFTLFVCIMNVLLFAPYLGSRSWLCMVLLLFSGLCLSSSCSGPEEGHQHASHPIWRYLNLPEDKISKDSCQITKFGCDFNGNGILRFHVTGGQRCLNKDSDLAKNAQNNIVEVNASKPTQTNQDSKENFIIMPDAYGYLTIADFPKTMHDKIEHTFQDEKNKVKGLPATFLEELEKKDCKNAVIIICPGLQGMLGVSDGLKKALKEKESKGECTYHILPPHAAVRKHNEATQNGKKVFTFIHLGS